MVSRQENPKASYQQTRLAEIPNNLPSVLVQDGPSTPTQTTSLTVKPDCARVRISAPSPTAGTGKLTAIVLDSLLFSGKKGFKFAKQPPKICEEADEDEFDTDKPIEEES